MKYFIHYQADYSPYCKSKKGQPIVEMTREFKGVLLDEPSLYALAVGLEVKVAELNKAFPRNKEYKFEWAKEHDRIYIAVDSSASKGFDNSYVAVIGYMPVKCTFSFCDGEIIKEGGEA